MKSIKYLAYSFALVVALASCSKDDEVKPENDLEQAELSFSAENPPIEIPTALQNSDNEYAVQISGWLSAINVNLAEQVKNIPEGAEVSTTPITAKSTGGRIAATAENVLVYTWSYGGQGQSITIAYQVSESDDKYKFDIFYDFDGEGYIHYVHAEEYKNRKEGFIDYLFGGDTYVLRYQWKQDADGTFYFDFLAEEFMGYRVSVVVNPDQSGTIEYFIEGELNVKATWNSTGTSGSWIYYEDGEVSETFTWES
ncbi:hypothetical protein [Fulvivirga ligni]|uniref:hypothetical protein n=1 Tax=Fulvivirga ligni TaxID=2904246 RepID=UPI001F2C8BCA|nr:hypothetical protein [Fulvivirga ligni]UII19352.1 hypothetical protein LVD16_16030 [Fulvivirga ligni]